MKKNSVEEIRKAIDELKPKPVKVLEFNSKPTLKEFFAFKKNKKHIYEFFDITAAAASLEQEENGDWPMWMQRFVGKAIMLQPNIIISGFEFADHELESILRDKEILYISLV